MGMDEREHSGLAVVGFSLLGTLALALVVGTFVASERFIYYWDYSGYWIHTIRLGELLDDPTGALAAVVESVRTQKYNLLAAVPLAPISRAFDHERTAWVLTVLLVYGLPATVAMVLAALRLGGTTRADRWAPAVAVATVALLPALWAPLIRGSVGIGGVPITVVIWLACILPVREMPMRRALGLGALLAGLILFRRWYGFWALAWVIALGVEAVIESRTWRERAAGLRVVAAMAGATGAILLLVATPIAVRMLTTDPAASRAAYRAADFYADGLAQVVQRFGILPLAFALGGLALAWQAPRTRRLARVLAIQTATVLLIFLRVQRFDRHHYYLVAPSIVVFAAVFLIDVARRARASRAARFALAASLGVLALGFAAAFAPTTGDALRTPWALLATPRYRPQVRDDLSEIVRLARALDALPARSGGGIYVLSSYRLLNEDVLRNAHLSTDAPDLSSRVLLSAHIDRKEAFPTRLMQADYAVVADPPRVHLKPEEQEVIVLPARQILAGEGIGRSFRLLPGTFTLQDGTTVSIYERAAPVPRAARRRLRALLDHDA